MTIRAFLAFFAAATLVVSACSSGDGTDPAAGSTPTTVPGPMPTEVAAALCAAVPDAVEPVPTVASTALTELSGLVASRTNDGLWWALNDSGNEPRLYAVGPNGEDLGSVLVEGAPNVDWEDLAIGPPPDGGGDDALFIADIGNNIGDRATVPILIVAEPDVGGGLPPSVSVQRTIELTWPAAPSDAEVLIVDPQRPELVIVTKRFGSAAGVFTAATDAGDALTLEERGTVDLVAAATVPADAPPSQVLGLGAATAGDVTATGDVVVVRTYGTALVWPREQDQSLADALVENPPCEAPTVGEPQGEALAVDPDGTGYRTISEGSQPPVNRFSTSP